MILKWYRRFALLSAICFYLVIAAGGIVRMTGSGMGCPDWPKCFGQIIPPTEASQLPANYKDIYSEKRLQKNIRFAAMLNKIGLETTADRILNDPSVYVEQDFNAFKTYVEYINRLIGAVSGLMVLGVVITGVALFSSSPLYLIWAALLLVVILFQGWLGSIVVSTNLLPGMITVHMVLALLLIIQALHIYTYKNQSVRFDIQDRSLLYLALTISFLQVVIGTQVREEVDVLKHTLSLDRVLWIDNLGGMYTLHKIGAIIVSVVNILAFVKLRKAQFSAAPVVLIALGFVLISGVAMHLLNMPAAMQPIHLFVACFLTGFYAYTILVSRSARPSEATGFSLRQPSKPIHHKSGI